jgi:hypothetical protein
MHPPPSRASRVCRMGGPTGCTSCRDAQQACGSPRGQLPWRQTVRIISRAQRAVGGNHERKEADIVATDFLTALDQLVTASQGNWRTFIRRLGPLHAQWHIEHNAGQATLGFLLFHWELIQRFDAIGAAQGLGGLSGIQPFSDAQLANFGAPYNVTAVVTNGDVTSFEFFSGDVEAWHNDAHMQVGMATGHNLMNPRTNVRRPEFWRLHYFINARFDEQLVNYAGAGSLPADVVVRLEADAAAVSLI